MKKLTLLGNLSDFLQNLTVCRLTNKQQKRGCEFFLSKYFFESDFCTNTPFFNPISKMFNNFSLKLNMANHRHVFLALWPQKRRNTLNKRKTNFALTCNFQKVIWALAFRSHAKFGNSFFSKFLVQCDSQSYKL